MNYSAPINPPIDTETHPNAAPAQSRLQGLKSRHQVIDGEVIDATDGIRVVAAPHPLKVETFEYWATPGDTLQEIVEHVQPDPILRRFSFASIDGTAIPRENWQRVRPKPNTLVNVRMVPEGGGGGKDPLRTLLLVAVLAASFIIPPLLPFSNTIIFGSGATAFTVGKAISVGITVVGGLLVNALVPPPKPRMSEFAGDSTDSPTMFIQGARNTLNPFGVVPNLLGRHRMTPPLGARSYTEIAGEEQFLRMVVVWGYGPITIEQEKIGETALNLFQDVEQEFKRGYQPSQITNQGNWSPGGGYPGSADFGDKYTATSSGTVDGVSYVSGDTIIYNNLAVEASSDGWDKNHDKDLKLFPDVVYEDSIGLILEQVNGYQLRTTQDSTDEISIDIVFAGGLVRFNNQGKKRETTVAVTVQYRPVGSSGSWTTAGIVTTSGQTTAAVRNTLRWTVSRNQYDVRVKRDTADSTDDKIRDVVTWSVLRTFTNEDPIQMEGIAVTALRIRASDQLRDAIDQYNAVCQSIVLDWNGSTWDYRPSSNNGSLFRHVLQGAANADARPDAEIGIANLQLFAEWCDTNGYEFNMVRDFQTSVAGTLDDVTAAGRGVKTLIDGTWSIVIDQTQTVPVQHFTPRNSWGFHGNHNYVDLPDAFRIRFFNELNAWLSDERIVYDDGFSVSNATRFERLEFPGITHPDHAWKLARFHLAQARLRPGEYIMSTDFEHIVCTRGSLVLVTHDVIEAGLGSARIADLTISTPNITHIIVDSGMEMEGGKSYGVSIRTPTDNEVLHSIVTNAGTQTTLELVTPTPSSGGPQIGDLLGFGELGSETIRCIVKSIGRGKHLSAELILVDEAPGVQTADTSAIPPYDSQVSLPVESEWPAITGMRSDEDALVINPDGSWFSRILVDMQFAGRRDTHEISGVEFRFRPTGTNSPYSYVRDAAKADQVSLTPVDDDVTYDINARFVTTDNSGVGLWGPTLEHYVIGATTPPADVTSAYIQGSNLVWLYPDPPPDFSGFNIRYHRGVNTHFDSGTLAHSGIWGGSPLDLSGIPNGTVSLMIKAVDVAGNESVNAAIVIRDIGDPLQVNIVDTVDYVTLDFPGTITDGSQVGAELHADDNGTLFWAGDDAKAFWESNDLATFWTTQYLAMQYEFEYTPLLIDAQDDTQLFMNLAGQAISEVEYRLDGPSQFWNLDSSVNFWSGNDADLMWEGFGDYQPWPSSITGLLHQLYGFRITTLAGSVQGKITTLQLIADVPDEQESFDDFVIASGGSRLTPTKTYREIRVVNGTLQEDGGDAITVKILDKDETLGPLVQAFDDVDAGTAATADFIIQGVKG